MPTDDATGSTEALSTVRSDSAPAFALGEPASQPCGTVDARPVSGIRRPSRALVPTLRRAFHRLSIRTTLVLTIVVSVSLVALLGTAASVYSDVKALRRAAEDQARTAVSVLSQDLVRLLLLDDASVGADAVSKLSAFSDVRNAFVYGVDGDLRFRYQREPDDALVPPESPVAAAGDPNLYLSVPVVYEGTSYGTALFRISAERFREQLKSYLGLMLWLLPMLLAACAALGLLFGRVLTAPLLTLVECVGRVSRDHDYSVRVDVDCANEIGLLRDGFNDMLARIESAAQVLESQKERLQVTLESIGDGVMTTDASGCVEYLNPVARSMLGCRTDEVRGRRSEEILRLRDEQQDLPVENPVDQCIAEGVVVKIPRQLDLLRRDGDELAVEISAAPIRAEGSEVQGAIVVVRDVTQSRRLTRELSHRASHDALTGLVNRYQFERQLDFALERAHESGEICAAFYLDLDQFKVVNDTCGHAAGDQLLRHFAVELSRQIRRHDVLARLGGDEFGVLLHDCPLDKAEGIAEKMREAAQRFRFVWDDRNFVISASIGVVPVGQPGDTVSSVLSAADTACYAAKDEGRNRVHVFRPGDADVARRRGEMELVSCLHEALEQDRFELYYQAIVPVDAVDETGLHGEILLRMHDASGRLLAPGAFLPAAERFNLMPAIDRWVVRTVFRELRAHPATLAALDLCTVNLSGATLTDGGFLDFVLQQMRDTGIPATKICFALTETVAVANMGKARSFMSALRKHGVRFALDDFGSGMSSFYYLRNLPCDFVKIDGGFVKNMSQDPIDAAMVRSINEIGKLMGKRTVAEFVEDARTLELLAQVGVDYAQGYGVALPEPLVRLFDKGTEMASRAPGAEHARRIA
jgi:diguanylate cyclase (GGDEF)-like protein/PAS domain S-box-containing protein